MVKPLWGWTAFLAALLAVLPVGSAANISSRTRLRAGEVRYLLDQADLVGSSPDQVGAFLDRQGLQHLEYVKWSPDPASKPTMEAWTTKGLGVAPHATLLAAEGCVWITLKFDETDRLKSFSVKPGFRSGFDV